MNCGFSKASKRHRRRFFFATHTSAIPRLDPFRRLGCRPILLNQIKQALIEEAKERTLAQEQSEQRRRLLVEAARSDRLMAEEKLERGESPAALAQERIDPIAAD